MPAPMPASFPPPPELAPVRRALLSVSNKVGLVPFAKRLAGAGVELVSTGGTARALREAGLEVLDVSALTRSPEMMDGRVKTLHPAVHGGILARRGHVGDEAAMAEHGIGAIDLVVVNLYPFRETVAREGVADAEAVEQIDIGGPTMVRAAAKNHAHVGVVTSPDRYGSVADALEANGGSLPWPLRRELAAEAFVHTAQYDAAIAAWMAGRLEADEANAQDVGPQAPPVWGGPLARAASLRYGENPHQPAGLYWAEGAATGLRSAQQLQGKALSYNNYIDLDAAYALGIDLGPTGVAILKHTNPCGAARSDTSLAEAFDLALACDPTSAFGGIVATQGTVDLALADKLAGMFLEVVLCAGVTDDARARLARKKNLRVLVMPRHRWAADGAWLPRPIAGGLLVQAPDTHRTPLRGATVATERAPTDAEWSALEFAWTLVRHVKSNAIVYAHGDRSVGIGAGQMSRVDASRIAVAKAQSPLDGTAIASDAFFPFADGVVAAAEAGATCVVQPGGSIRDQEVVDAANAHGLAMVLTGARHFRH